MVVVYFLPFMCREDKLIKLRPHGFIKIIHDYDIRDTSTTFVSQGGINFFFLPVREREKERDEKFSYRVTLI